MEGSDHSHSSRSYESNDKHGRGHGVARTQAGTYTARFNRRHKLFGHLFGGRYKSLVVDGSGTGYLKTVRDYVHLNPARGGLVKPEESLRAFPWSSWPAFLLAPATLRETPAPRP